MQKKELTDEWDQLAPIFMNYEKMLPKRCQRQSQTSKSMDFSGVFSPVQIIPTRQMKPLPKHFCFGHLISFDSD